MSKLLMRTARVALVLGIAGVVVVGCGRKGDLDRPSTPVEQQNLRKTAEHEKKPAPAPEHPFLLDPLL